VVETDVHFPTDINLLLDAIRKVIEISAELSGTYNLPGWRQHLYHQRQFKRQYRKVQRLKHSTSKDEIKKQQKDQEIKDAHRAYLELAEVSDPSGPHPQPDRLVRSSHRGLAQRIE